MSFSYTLNPKNKAYSSKTGVIVCKQLFRPDEVVTVDHSKFEPHTLKSGSEPPLLVRIRGGAAPDHVLLAQGAMPKGNETGRPPGQRFESEEEKPLPMGESLNPSAPKAVKAKESAVAAELNDVLKPKYEVKADASKAPQSIAEAKSDGQTEAVFKQNLDTLGRVISDSVVVQPALSNQEPKASRRGK